MKTQINDIKRGNQFVSGTAYRIRYERAKTILAENGDTLNITYKGIAITLERYTWRGGKTWVGGRELTPNQIRALFPDDMKYLQEPQMVSYRINLNEDCTAEIIRYRRRSMNGKWKEGYHYQLDNAHIVIL